jgi:predicted glutamine amidotransferase
MCIIVICENNKPSFKELKLMEQVNTDGAGVAWREENYVTWKKGLNAKEVYELIQKLNYPYIVHFRLATCGGKSPHLCHPFPVEKDVSLDLEGKTKAVLFHNGVWHDWRNLCLQTVIQKNVKFPCGAMSDTRAMAWFVNIHGTSVLNLINEKVVVFTNKKIMRFGEGWIKDDGIIYSNKLYNSFYNKYNCFDPTLV